MCLHPVCLLIPPGYSALLRLPGFHLRPDKAACSQLRGHGPLRKVLPDPAAGGQPGGGGAQQRRGGRQGLEGGAGWPGVTTDRSLRLCSAGLDRLQSTKPNTDVTSVSSSLKAKSEGKRGSYWWNSACIHCLQEQVQFELISRAGFKTLHHPDVTKRKQQIWFQTIDSFLPQQFERDLRRFARKERKMLLDNHGLFDKTKVGGQRVGTGYTTITKPRVLIHRRKAFQWPFQSGWI